MVDVVDRNCHLLDIHPRTQPTVVVFRRCMSPQKVEPGVPPSDPKALSAYQIVQPKPQLQQQQPPTAWTESFVWAADVRFPEMKARSSTPSQHQLTDRWVARTKKFVVAARTDRTACPCRTRIDPAVSCYHP